MIGPVIFIFGLSSNFPGLMPTIQNADILQAYFVGLGLFELAWVTIGLIRNRSKSSEDLRRLGVGLDWLAGWWQPLPDQQLTLRTSPWPHSCPDQTKDKDKD